jgi:hypothetical protein
MLIQAYLFLLSKAKAVLDDITRCCGFTTMGLMMLLLLCRLYIIFCPVSMLGGSHLKVQPHSFLLGARVILPDATDNLTLQVAL